MQPSGTLPSLLQPFLISCSSSVHLKRNRILLKVPFSRRAADGPPELAQVTGDTSNSRHACTSSPTQPDKQDAVRAASVGATPFAATPFGAEVCRAEIPPPGRVAFNNYIFHQDPETGRLSLLPVLLRAARSLPGLDINPSLVPDLFLNAVPVPLDCGQYDYLQASSYCEGSAVIAHLDPRDHSGFLQQEDAAGRRSGVPSARVHPALTEVIHLLKGDFSLDGYLDRGHEDVAMGA